MKLPLLAAAIVMAGAHQAAEAKLPPLRDPVFLNIGFVCRWENRCIERQRKAMDRALAYVKKTRPAAWKIQQCNRNASRSRGRVDWIGYNHCIRNPKLTRSSNYASRRRR